MSKDERGLPTVVGLREIATIVGSRQGSQVASVDCSRRFCIQLSNASPSVTTRTAIVHHLTTGHRPMISFFKNKGLSYGPTSR